MKNFIINLDKPKGICSTKAGAFLKKTFSQKKIGHLGTLDPLATGVLPFFGGKYTKLIPYFQNEYKAYTATICLGADSDTLDIESQVTYLDCIPFSRKEIQAVIQDFKGAIIQVAPSYSALKYQGKPYYYYARKNVTIPLKSRKIDIFKIKLISYLHPKISFYLECSKGCYVRSLARDIGKKLGTSAILEKLERTQIGKQFTKKNIVCLDEICKKKYNKDIILEPWDLLNHYTLVNIEKIDIDFLQKGQRIKVCQQEVGEKIAFAFWKKTLIAIGMFIEHKSDLFFQPKKVLI